METLSFLGSFIIYIPLLIVYVVGSVIAIVRWPQHPRASLLLLIGLGIQILLIIFNIARTVAFPFLYSTSGFSPTQLGSILSLMGIAQSFCGAFGWASLLIGYFVDRHESPHSL